MASKLDLYRPDHGRRPYWLGLLIALDQFVNAALGGYVDETLSSRAHREGWVLAERLIDRLFWWDRQGEIHHCELAFYGELAREHFPPAVEPEPLPVRLL
ncbi:hypothetical protein AvCA_37410 [Azotobacter vinelandii CA]|uniref:Uncharacterized protein n=2 Tax=Azotobacter vinelandii TaxID=354 RepID=C1DS11_AZOVD|nr:hypothetical protein [Azotobacter vinelandii]ACO79886.1 hypothetical protein Avin_37410 [Azotobacter vinelandii DJ]AGK16173.1 hypothetical protein AvCA_37410 [Azotobacter vinelandii CA]AGK21576.1 hypothetical protein AvCA6_37410 [Azotobacter vinelandii CA6]SFX44462.1 hypothetical protein SAMN04244547_01600 [Azotobacter vinelandii]GLK62304.1 hypothetical protein GCM10017624_44680 [Azotobacter vinelandii]